jgi:hypothetical protein
VVFLAAVGTLAACDRTVSPERAYERCSERARLAAAPRGSIGIGAGSGGGSANFDVTITSDFLQGRDPYLVYDTCFRDLTGAGPTRPLIL